MFAAPTMVKRLVEHRDGGALPGLKTIVYGGGPMYVADCQAALARFGNVLVQIYGQGESPMTIHLPAARRPCRHRAPARLERLASVGPAFTGSKSASPARTTKPCRRAKSAKSWCVATR
jgi:acyl-CoA synthetase (AMP-forming)/AMP-acid ligase II